MSFSELDQFAVLACTCKRCFRTFEDLAAISLIRCAGDTYSYFLARMPVHSRESIRLIGVPGEVDSLHSYKLPILVVL